jgi:hypothetical protein
MKLFEQELENYVKHHIDPISPNSLDPRVWYFLPDGGDPKLQPEVKSQILNDINAINSAEQESANKRVWDYFMVGPALEESSSVKCPINIIVQINTANLVDMLKELILNRIKDINGKLATGTVHPLYYIPTVRKFDKDKYDAVYHPFTEKWIKKPRFLGESSFDLDNLHKDIDKKKKFAKYSLKRGLKKLTKI